MDRDVTPEQLAKLQKQVDPDDNRPEQVLANFYSDPEFGQETLNELYKLHLEQWE